MAGGKLIFDKYTENLAEIAMTYADLVQKHPQLTDNNSITWKQQFVEWANEFEELHPDIDDNPDKDYLLLIWDFAKQKILEFGGIEEKPFYFTFGSWEKYPYPSRYLVVYAENVREAVQKFRSKHPDIRENTVNCAAWYTEEQKEVCIQRGTWYKGDPAEIIR